MNLERPVAASDPDKYRARGVDPAPRRFATACEPLQDASRSPFLRLIDRRYRHDLFERFALTFERLGDLDGKRGLDIGCGSGAYIAEAIRLGARHVVGLDPAPGALELARRRIEQLGRLDDVELASGYFPDVAPPGPFDFAIAIGVLDYVAQPLPFLRALRGVVTGRAAVSFPSKHWLATPLRRIRYLLSDCPVYFYSERMIRSIAEQAGYGTVDIVKMDGAGMDYHVCLEP